MEGETLNMASRLACSGAATGWVLNPFRCYCCCRCAQVQHPCILQHFDAFLERVNGKRVAVFLDYDGTFWVQGGS